LSRKNKIKDLGRKWKLEGVELKNLRRRIGRLKVEEIVLIDEENRRKIK